MNEQYSPTGFRVLPLVVKHLLIINILMFVAAFTFERFNIDLTNILGLHFFKASDFRIYQLITYMFMHVNFGHLFFNMFALWMFGAAIENYWGAKRFLIFYLVTGIGAALTHYGIIAWQMLPTLNYLDACIANPTIETINALAQHHKFVIDPNNAELINGFEIFKENVDNINYGSNILESKNAINEYLSQYREYLVSQPNIVGASGSIFGLLLAFGMMFPNSLIYLYFFIPIKAKWFVIGYGLIELIYGISGTSDGVAHFAHLGGMLFGLLLILYWRKKAKQHWEY